jgi:hypothetical protein
MGVARCETGDYRMWEVSNFAHLSNFVQMPARASEQVDNIL